MLYPSNEYRFTIRIADLDMNDKTLKIRIKLHSAGTSSESPSGDPDEYKRRIAAPQNLEKGNPKRLPLLAGSFALVALLLVAVYVFNKQDTDKSEKFDTAASPELELDDSVAQESQATENRSEIIKLTDSGNFEPESRLKQAKSDSLELSSDKPTAQAVTDQVTSKPIAARSETLTSSTLHTEYAAIEAATQEYKESSTQAQNEAENSLSEHYPESSSRLDENDPTLITSSMSSENEAGPVALAEPQSEYTLNDSASSGLPQVARAHFTSGIEAREPVDRVKKIFHSDGQKLKRLYYFTELRGMKGDSIIHRWDHRGRTVANLTFNISGDRWRVYSSKNLPSSMKGRWNVVVTDSSGNPLVSESFVYD